MNVDLLLIIALLFSLVISFPSLIQVFNGNNTEKLSKKIIAFGKAYLLSFIIFILLISPLFRYEQLKPSSILVICILVIISYWLENIIVYLTNFFRVKFSKDKNIYIRDVFVKYSPAVLSLLSNHKIENRKDFDATVLNIHSKGLIKFYRENDVLKIIDTKEEKKKYNLTEDEKYIYNVVTDKEKFSQVKWYNLIHKEIDRLNFVKKQRKILFSQILHFYIIFLKVFCVAYMLLAMYMLTTKTKTITNIVLENYYLIQTIVAVICIIPLFLGVIGAIIAITNKNVCTDKKYYYTKYGALEVLKWEKFKKFINDYSLIEYATVESVVLWEKYLAYAMALNVNKAYNSDELKEINKCIEEFSFNNIYFDI